MSLYIFRCMLFIDSLMRICNIWNFRKFFNKRMVKIYCISVLYSNRILISMLHSIVFCLVYYLVVVLLADF